MDDFFQILVIIAFIVMGLLGSSRKKKRQQQTRSRSPLHPRAAPGTRRAAVPTRHEDLLRELENLFTGRVPSSPRRLPAPEEPTEAVSLEPVDAPETASWEEGLKEAATVQETTAWEEGLHRDTKSLETLEGAESHARFHRRYDHAEQRPLAHPVSQTFHTHDLMRAVVWAEIMNRPVSMRD
jgi:hypothetical protein